MWHIIHTSVILKITGGRAMLTLDSSERLVCVVRLYLVC